MCPILFNIGSFTIYTYGVLVFMGVMAGYLFAMREAKKCRLDTKLFSDILFWSIIGAFIGARVLYLIVEWDMFIEEPVAMLFSRAGFVFYGGVIGGLIVLYFLTRKYRVNFLEYVDIIALTIPLGHFFGRLGCFFYGCCYGLHTDSWIGIEFPHDSPAGIIGGKVIPTQLISAFFLLIIFSLLLFIRRRQRFRGQILLSYFILYGTFRFIIEFFRGDPRGFLGIFSTSQIIALLLVGIGVFSWCRLSRSS
jgi:phosphatidylglycerol:prolipoprotein diacylglycerol transferase